MSTGTPVGTVCVVDAYAHFQPIRLSIKSLVELHRETAEKLDDFVAEHRMRFPHGPIGKPSLR